MDATRCSATRRWPCSSRRSRAWQVNRRSRGDETHFKSVPIRDSSRRLLRKGISPNVKESVLDPFACLAWFAVHLLRVKILARLSYIKSPKRGRGPASGLRSNVFRHIIKAFCRKSIVCCFKSKAFCFKSIVCCHFIKAFCRKSKASCSKSKAFCRKSKASCSKSKVFCRKSKASCYRSKVFCRKSKASCYRSKVFCRKSKAFYDKSKAFCPKNIASCKVLAG